MQIQEQDLVNRLRAAERARIVPAQLPGEAADALDKLAANYDAVARSPRFGLLREVAGAPSADTKVCRQHAAMLRTIAAAGTPINSLGGTADAIENLATALATYAAQTRGSAWFGNIPAMLGIAGMVAANDP